MLLHSAQIAAISSTHRSFRAFPTAELTSPERAGVTCGAPRTSSEGAVLG